jgi:hypothetical protein
MLAKKRCAKLSEAKQYFKGDDMDKAVDWVKERLKTSDIVVDIEGTHIESGARVSASGLVIEAESGFGKPDILVVRLDKKVRWSAEQMLSIGKPDSDKDDADVGAEEIFLKIKKHSETHHDHPTKKYARDYEHHRTRRRTYYEHRNRYD